jgi:Zn finger protein HypA/HybF involved in hydrogenase expression
MDNKTMSYIEDTPTGYLLLCPYCQSEVEVKLNDTNCPKCSEKMYFPKGVDW